MLPFKSNLNSLPVYQPGKPIEEVARVSGMRPEDIIKLASNENPLGPSPAAVQAMKRAAESVHLYPDGNAHRLKEKLASNLGVRPGNLILGNGSNELIEFVGHALLEPDSEVVVSQYSFAIYTLVARLFGAKTVSVPARKFGHDLKAMGDAIGAATRIVFVANPNNPTGTLAPRDEVVALINRVPPDVLLVMDEAYIEFLREPVDLIPLIRKGDMPNLILFRTFSKIHGLAGLRLGYAIGHLDTIAHLEKIRQPFNINSVAQAAAIAALGDADHVQKTAINNRAGIEFFELAFRRLGVEFVTSHANFILVKVGNGSAVFESMQARGIITRPMAGYQLPDWIRISIGTGLENQRCLDALTAVLEEFSDGTADAKNA